MKMTPQIETRLQQLDNLEKELYELSKVMMSSGRGIFPLDQLAIGVINRSLSLLSGFSLLLRNSNYIGAAHLARPHLDNYLRFFGAWLVNDPQDFAMQTLKGVRIEKIINRYGKPLSDSNLIKYACKEYPWMKKVYHETSGFIHLSKKHILTSGKVIDKEERTIQFAVSKFDKYVKDESRLEAIECMIEITNCIKKLIEGWIWTKSNEDKLDELKKNGS